MVALIYYFLSANLTFATSPCPVGNLKVCQSYLKTQHQKGESVAFAAAYSEVCATNPKFSCVKIIVRADVNLELKEQTKFRGPMAALYTLTLDGENFIYVLTDKSDAK